MEYLPHYLLLPLQQRLLGTTVQVVVIVTTITFIIIGTIMWLWLLRNQKTSFTKVRSLKTFMDGGDVKMGKGKAAAQCCHAVLETFKIASAQYPSLVAAWEELGQPKVTLKVQSESELNDLVRQARQSGLPAASIRDAGRTQLAAGTKTVAAIGPGPAKMIDIITGHLKLY